MDSISMTVLFLCMLVMLPVGVQARVATPPDPDTLSAVPPAPQALVGSIESSGLASSKAVPQSMSMSWTGNPNVNLPVCTADGAQFYPCGTSDGAGGAIYTWIDGRSINGGIYAQHVLSSGTVDPSWTTNGNPVFVGPGLAPVITSDGGGGAFIAWVEVSFLAPRFASIQHLLSTGVVDPSWPASGLLLSSASATAGFTRIVSDGAHGAIVTWHENRGSGTGFDVYAQHFTTSGVDPAWPTNGVPVCTAIRNQRFPELCSDGAGGAIVAWGDARSLATSSDIYAQHILASGIVDPAWTANGTPVCIAPGFQRFDLISPAGIVGIENTSADNSGNEIISDGAGGCILAWGDVRTPANGSDVYAQHVLSSGIPDPAWTPNGVALSTAIDDQGAPFLVPDGAGGAVAVWSSGPSRDIVALHVRGNGSLDGPANGLVLATAGGPAFDTGDFVYSERDGAGGAFLSWADHRNEATSGRDLYAHHVRTAPSFGADPGWPANGVAVSTAAGDQGFSSGSIGMVSNGTGGAIVGWDDTRDGATNDIDIYAQGLCPSGSLELSPPPVATITGPPSGSVHAVNTSVTFTGSISDNAGDTHVAKWYFDGVLATDPVTITGDGSTSATVSTSHVFTAAGVYMVKLVVTDQCGGSSTATQVGGFDAMVVIYDPNAGFVTGGGWINSPAGAYVPDPSLAGKANFGLVSKYQKGAAVPTGNTEFQFKVANLNFHSTSYDWLVIAGSKAQYKGSGSINGGGDYKFILTAIDGDLQGNSPDKFRMKITTAGGGLVYDNQMGGPDGADPTTVLGGGSIVIQKSGAGGASLKEDPTAAIDYSLSQGQPNPFEIETEIHYSVPERSRVTIQLFDISGRKVRDLVAGEREAGRYSVELASQDRTGRLRGVYFLRMNASSRESGSRFASTRTLVVLR